VTPDQLATLAATGESEGARGQAVESHDRPRFLPAGNHRDMGARHPEYSLAHAEGEQEPPTVSLRPGAVVVTFGLAEMGAPGTTGKMTGKTTGKLTGKTPAVVLRLLEGARTSDSTESVVKDAALEWRRAADWIRRRRRPDIIRLQKEPQG
jgi:hypothetical protein